LEHTHSGTRAVRWQSKLARPYKQVQLHARHKQIETTMTYVHQRDRLCDSAADYINLENDGDK